MVDEKKCCEKETTECEEVKDCCEQEKEECTEDKECCQKESAIKHCPECNGLMERHFSEGDSVHGSSIAQWMCLDCGFIESLHAATEAEHLK